MATKILVPLVDGFEEIEVSAVVDILRRAGIEVTMAGIGGNIVTGAHGIRVNSDARMLDINADSFSGIVLPGGSPGTENLMRSERVTKIVDDFSKQGKLVAAICAAPRILAKLGLLKERKATIYPGYEKELGKPRNDPVVADGNIITSQGPGTAVAFALKIVEQLMGKPKMLQIKQNIVA
ncbi:DJ-1/PfpI family protein [archaeon]|nr:MAG: DJ-1/PfpI family protein [archaeon]